MRRPVPLVTVTDLPIRNGRLVQQSEFMVSENNISFGIGLVANCTH